MGPVTTVEKNIMEITVGVTYKIGNSAIESEEGFHSSVVKPLLI